MIKDRTILAVIPARGGSKGVPRKNIRYLAGKPLIAWTIEAAKKSCYIDRVMLSSEDEEIARIAQEWGCEVPFRRPPELATDETPGIAPILHALQMLPSYDYVVVLQPTSPLRDSSDIDTCIERCVLEEASSCISVTEADDSPYLMYFVSDGGQMKKVLRNEELPARRQDLPKVFMLNGAVYVVQSKFLESRKTFIGDDTIAFIMPKERSLDIDTEADLVRADYIIQKKGLAL